jgi:Carboxypeptidase regulatory-like domain
MIKTFMWLILAAGSAICTMEFSDKFQTRGSIRTATTGFGGLTGYVFDADGKPVANAEVFALLAEGSLLIGRRPTAETDKDGKFVLNHVKAGLNRVFAFKEQNGYPDTSFAFYQLNSVATPEIYVREGHVVSGVIVRLGQKSEMLSGAVLDADSRSPIKHAQITLYWASNPSIYLSFSSDAEGKFARLLPPIPIQIKASARGYQESRINIQALTKSDQLKTANKNPNEITVLLRSVK